MRLALRLWNAGVAAAALLAFVSRYDCARCASASEGVARTGAGSGRTGPAALAALDADLASGKYGLVDSMLVIRCGKQAFERSYARDYDKIYGERAKKTGPLNHDLHGPYNYFSTEFHPYYEHSDLHTMQSVSKTVTSITIGVAMQRGEFKVRSGRADPEIFRRLQDRERRRSQAADHAAASVDDDRRVWSGTKTWPTTIRKIPRT